MHEGNGQQAESLSQDMNQRRDQPPGCVDGVQGSHTLPSLHPAQQASQLLAQSVLVSSAVLAALRPGVLPGDEAKPILECLIRLAAGLTHVSMQEAAMVAAAAGVNKWPTGAL